MKILVRFFFVIRNRGFSCFFLYIFFPLCYLIIFLKKKIKKKKEEILLISEKKKEKKILGFGHCCGEKIRVRVIVENGFEFFATTDVPSTSL